MAEEKKVEGTKTTAKPAATTKAKKTTAAQTSTPKANAGSGAGNIARVAAALIPGVIAAAGILGSPSVPPMQNPTAIVQTVGTPTRRGPALVEDGSVPLPLLAPGHPVDWWFVFKLNATAFPKCGTLPNTCPFGGTAQTYRFGQQFAYASSEAPGLVTGGQQCMGTSTGDPVGATYDEVFNGGFHYLIWNDQFHDLNPAVQGCDTGDCGAPWGHSKGMVAWNDAGEGFVMQVSTPSWPGTGSSKFKDRKIGNTLGCIAGDDDVEVSQHFFALRLTEPDLMAVLHALREAGVVTDPSDPQIAQIGGPNDVVQFFKQETPWKRPAQTAPDGTTPPTIVPLSVAGVKLIAKPSSLNVPPWQMVSSLLGGVGLRAATWWATPPIPSTVAGQVPGCWDSSLKGQAPGAVDIALIGTWEGKTYSLKGDDGGNHAKIGVSTTGAQHLVIFGDENQQGKLGPGDCTSSQNGRGGMFFVMEEPTLQQSMTALISAGAGDTAPTK
jgi:hypothetical protein